MAEFKMDLVDEQIGVTTMGLTVASPVATIISSIPSQPRTTIPWREFSRVPKPSSSSATTRLIELQDGRKEPVEQKTDYAKLIAENQAELKSLNKKVAGLKKELKGKYKEDPIYKGIISKIKKTQNELKKNRARLTKSDPLAMGVREGKPEDAKVLGEPCQIDSSQSGRLQLAEWISDPAKVFANRVWHHLFGRGIVSTVDNFGETGERPSNLPLLDHLATRFVEDGWSVKKLVFGPAHDPANAKIDPASGK